MYAACSIVEANKQSLRYCVINHAPFLASEMVLFKVNLVSMREASGDPGLSG